ncbi:hypothetical protein BU24DRAFT_463032 [Aaosphaeria arxii CBS 175.79]|uniref:Uncharacterized protein n=1 Tax=Aaosphaeria arxii CBS 175.79 TaxID=1450172 RepID=A0A6A5XPE8_9PLEO|nr:uncharacterized protein BU24DRAFT_463032 [Aaosphaeria arxii CBS 175.79]KAF2014224.1 hypothetical protein BU24DRAFT_463032 [Aaosphaeria arxii CBS 175.79]
MSANTSEEAADYDMAKNHLEAALDIYTKHGHDSNEAFRRIVKVLGDLTRSADTSASNEPPPKTSEKAAAEAKDNIAHDKDPYSDFVLALHDADDCILHRRWDRPLRPGKKLNFACDCRRKFYSIPAPQLREGVAVTGDGENLSVERQTRDDIEGRVNEDMQEGHEGGSSWPSKRMKMTKERVACVWCMARCIYGVPNLSLHVDSTLQGIQVYLQ